MKRSSSGLATLEPPPKVEEVPRRRKGLGEKIIVSLRLNQKQWERLHDFAFKERTSMNQLAIDGISVLLQRKGLDPL